MKSDQGPSLQLRVASYRIYDTFRKAPGGIEADTREMGLEDYGTKMGWEFEDLSAFKDSPYYDVEEEKKKDQRK